MAAAGLRGRGGETRNATPSVVVVVVQVVAMMEGARSGAAPRRPNFVSATFRAVAAMLPRHFFTR